jgi:hypothetical protein
MFKIENITNAIIWLDGKSLKPGASMEVSHITESVNKLRNSNKISVLSMPDHRVIYRPVAPTKYIIGTKINTPPKSSTPASYKPGLPIVIPPPTADTSQPSAEPVMTSDFDIDELISNKKKSELIKILSNLGGECEKSDSKKTIIEKIKEIVS